MPLLDLTLQFLPLRQKILEEITLLADAQQFILGPKVERFERAVAEYCGAPDAIGVSSGTDALLVTLMALGIGPGDAVVTTPYTFFATAGGIARAGARPVFIDIEPATCNISPAKLREWLSNCRRDETGAVFAPSGERVCALLPVHLFGLCCEMDEICALGAEFNLPVIEDAAQALGAEYPSRDGVKKAGAIGEFGHFSFFPSKNLGAFGDGGMVLCRDAEMAARIRTLRNHGMEQRYHHRIIGGNFRLDALQAAVLQVKLPHLDNWSEWRRENAAVYREEFADAGLGSIVTLPAEPFAAGAAANHHIYNQFVIRVPRRDELCRHLEANGIGHAIYYPVPLHLQECFASLGYQPGDFPEAERAARETVALPIFPELAHEQQKYVVRTVAEFYAP